MNLSCPTIFPTFYPVISLIVLSKAIRIAVKTAAQTSGEVGIIQSFKRIEIKVNTPTTTPLLTTLAHNLSAGKKNRTFLFSIDLIFYFMRPLAKNERNRNI